MPTKPKESDVPPLQGIEDYPRWAQHAEAELQSQNCQDAILSTEEPLNKEVAIQHFLSIGYDRDSICTATTMEWVEKKLNKREERNVKAIGILKKLVGAKNTQMIERKSASEIWITLKEKFKDTSPMSQLEAIRKACLIRMSDFSSASLYCNAYESALNRLSGMLQDDSIVNRNVVEALLQEAMLANVTEKYKPLITQLRESWTPTNTDLSKACLRINRYDFATTADAHASPKALYIGATRRDKAPIGTCDFEECVKRENTSHYKDKCWRKDPALKPKWMLNKMKTRGTGGAAKDNETTTTNATSQALAPAPAPSNITS